MVSFLTKWLLFLVVLFLPACTTDKIVARVGSREIRASEVAYRDQVIRLYYPEETRSLGLDQLLRSHSAALILEKYGHLISDSDIIKEEQRMRAEPNAPEQLARIEKIFGADFGAFRRVYVFPTLVERVFYYDFFLHDPKIQAASRRPAEDFLARAKASSFAKAAQLSGLRPVELRISAKQGVVIKGETRSAASIVANSVDGTLPVSAPQEEGSRLINEVLKGRKPGDFIARVIDLGEYWAIARYLRVARKQYVLEAVLFKKADFSAWFALEKAKL